MTKTYRRARCGHGGIGSQAEHSLLMLGVFLAAGGVVIPATARAWGPGPAAPPAVAPGSPGTREREPSSRAAAPEVAPGYDAPEQAYPPPPDYGPPQQAYPPPPNYGGPQQAYPPQPNYAAPEQAYPPPNYAAQPQVASPPWPGYPPGYYGQAYPYGYGYPPPPPPGSHTHDGGYLRLQIGFNWTELSASNSGNTADYPGSGASLAIAVGYSFKPSFVLYLEGLIAGASDGEVNLNGERVAGASYSTNVLGFGPGGAYYFDSNVFVAATFLLAKAQLTDSDGHVLVDSKAGAGLELLLGKEWWVSDNWGCGISGQFIVGKMKGKDMDPTLLQVPNWTTRSLSLLFSATYN